MLTLIVAFFFSFLLFGFFIYYYAWYNRHTARIRLAVNETGGRVVSIKRVVKTAKKIRVDPQLEGSPGILTASNIEWNVVYKDRFETLREARCRILNGTLYWHPPLL